MSVGQEEDDPTIVVRLKVCLYQEQIEKANQKHSHSHS